MKNEEKLPKLKCSKNHEKFVKNVVNNNENDVGKITKNIAKMLEKIIKIVQNVMKGVESSVKIIENNTFFKIFSPLGQHSISKDFYEHCHLSIDFHNSHYSFERYLAVFFSTILQHFS